MLISDHVAVALDQDCSKQTAETARPSRLQRLCADIRCAVAESALHREQRVAQVLALYLSYPDLLQSTVCPCSADRYMRHLLDSGPDHTVLALVWRPRQMSSVHGHQTWCAFGLHTGWMVESFFTPGPDALEPQTCVGRLPGTVSHTPADPTRIHRLANLGVETAVTIHVYGASYDRIGDSVNRTWAE